MPAEWPISARPRGERTTTAPVAQYAVGGRRLSAVVQDLFLAPDERLTEQERSLMVAMLQGLIERIAVELLGHLPPATSEDCTVAPAKLLLDLSSAGLLQDEWLVGLLLRRADMQRLAHQGLGRRSTLQRWTADQDGDLAAAAMSLVAARGRSRDRFGRIALDLSDLPARLAHDLVMIVAAALGVRCTEPNDAAMVAAVDSLLSSQTETSSHEQLEADVVAALLQSGRRAPELLVELAEEGEAPLLSVILAHDAQIPADEAWAALLGGAERIALLLRLTDMARPEAAALLAGAGAGLGIGDPGRAIDAFDALSPAEVEAARREAVLPAAYRNARGIIRHRG